MCTAITLETKDHYFGRNLDLEYSYHETVVITPRNKRLPLRHLSAMESHYAMIGMAFVQNDFPLYYEATNEKGLSMAGLNFPGNAFFPPKQEGGDNVCTFELIPWILGSCENLKEARQALERINLCNTPFDHQLLPAPLHWMIADREGSIVLEARKEGMKIYDNPVGVLTNNPGFDYHMTRLAEYMHLSADNEGNKAFPGQDISSYCKGMSAIGLPGDVSSSSRFIRAAFAKLNSVCGKDERSSVSQFFKLLTFVEQIRGVCRLGKDSEGKELYEITVYSSCCNIDKGIYYYTTYSNRQISAVDMHKEDLNGAELISYELQQEEQICLVNS